MVVKGDKKYVKYIYLMRMRNYFHFTCLLRLFTDCQREKG